MPAGEGKSVAGDLGRMMPDLKWLTGASLHEAQQHVSKAWVPVTSDSWQDALKVQPAWRMQLSAIGKPC